MVVREYAAKDRSEAIKLLVQLQEHLVAVDDKKVQILTDYYRTAYLDYLFDKLREQRRSACCGKCHHNNRPRRRYNRVERQGRHLN